MSRAFEDFAASMQERLGADVSCSVVPVEGDPTRLWRAEQALVATAMPARQREFAAGRICARRLLAQLGFAPAALLRAGDRSPLWPSGAIGSIAHDGRLCAVSVARAGRLCALGLDLEPDEPLEQELWPELFRARELERLAAGSLHAGVHLARLYFSAKECVYKGTHALVDALLGFQDVEIELVPGADRFRAHVHHPAAAALEGIALEGFYFSAAGSILTGMALSTPSVRTGRPCIALA